MQSYNYKLTNFEGPLDLLLYLIEKNKVDIYDIPIVKIADQFNQYIRDLHEFDVNYASKFLVMAATLLQIKSRYLLPKTTATAVDEEQDPREELVQQLLEYKRIKQVSQQLVVLWNNRSLVLERGKATIVPTMTFTGQIDYDTLFSAFKQIYEARSVEEPIAYLSTEELSIDQRIAEIIEWIKASVAPIYIFSLFYDCRNRMELIVTFMAVLEILRLGQCTVSGRKDEELALQWREDT